MKLITDRDNGILFQPPIESPDVYQVPYMIIYPVDALGLRVAASGDASVLLQIGGCETIHLTIRQARALAKGLKYFSKRAAELGSLTGVTRS